MKNQRIILMLFCFLFFSCKKQELFVSDYMHFVENPDNGLKIERTIDYFSFTAQYKPIDYVVALESNGGNIDKKFYQSRRDELKGYEYFNFKITSKINQEILQTHIQNQNEYYYRIQYFISNLQKDFKLIIQSDTFPCTVYNFERIYAVAPFCNLVLGFEITSGKPDPEFKDDGILLYNDKVLEDFGPVQFVFKDKNLKGIPKLKII